MGPTKKLPLEICVDSVSGILVAARSGADRIELCSALPLGGLTPGAGLVAAAVQCAVPSHAMIRPRPGDFLYEGAEHAACVTDVIAMRRAGLAGVVIGAAKRDSTLDASALKALVDAAEGMEVTLHRVFDLTPDPFAALEQAIELGITRILTSGGAPSADAGADLLARLVRHASGRIQIMAGGGVNAGNAQKVIATGVDALHASCGSDARLRQSAERIGIGPGKATDAGKISALQAVLQAQGEPAT